MSVRLPVSFLAFADFKIVILFKADFLLYIRIIGLLLVLFIMDIVLFKLLYIKKHFDRGGKIIHAPEMFSE
jgi:hypothetical protein